jgi:hypothetical protein
MINTKFNVKQLMQNLIKYQTNLLHIHWPVHSKMVCGVNLYSFQLSIKGMPQQMQEKHSEMHMHAFGHTLI